MLRSHLRALALLPLEQLPPPSRRALWLTAALHLFGLLAVARLAHWPIYWLALGVALLCLPVLLARKFHPAQLAPLFLLYIVTGLRVAVAVAARFSGETSGAFTIPESFAPWLSFGWAAALAAVWCCTILAVWLLPESRRRWALAIPLGVGALAWAAWLYFSIVPAGVTGADPYAYTQMALDLLDHGTPLHRFPLSSLAFQLTIPVYPTLPVGYHVPVNGWSATAWPPGFSALLAGAVRLFGEGALFRFNSALGLLALIPLFIFAASLAPRNETGWSSRAAVGALAVALLATSQEQAVRLAVPLADLAAQVYTLLSLGLAMWATGDSPRRHEEHKAPFLSALAGAAFAVAFSIRYTQLLLAPAFLYLFLQSRPRSNHSRVWALKLEVGSLRFGIWGLSAFLFALPDLLYRWRVFGSPLASGSAELSHFALANVLPVLARTLSELFSLREFGLWLPFIVIGAWQLARERRREAIALALGYVPVFLFHLPYEFLRLRDLLFLWPVLAMLAAVGAWAAARWAGRHPAGRAAALVVGFALIAGRWSSLRNLPEGFYTSGGLLPGQRASLERLATLTEPDAVIADSLNSGAVELYGQRLTVRPGNILQPGRTWTEAEWLTFVDALMAQGRPLYLLMDSEEMDAPLEAVKRAHAIERVADLDVPYYYYGGGAENLTVPLFRIVPCASWQWPPLDLSCRPSSAYPFQIRCRLDLPSIPAYHPAPCQKS